MPVVTRLLVAALAAPLLLLPWSAQAADCTTSGCHDTFLERKEIHSALAAGDCTDCHQETEGETRCGAGTKFTTEADPDLCLMCHDAPPETGRHPALDAGCTACHDPHGSRYTSLLKAEPARLCAECHEAASGVSVHDPVAGGECALCHAPHASENPKLLTAPSEELCGMCHDKTSGEGIHEPVASGACLDCHSPHAADHPDLLNDAPRELCAGCHDVEAGMPGAVGSHFPVARGDCSACHATHANGTPKFLKAAGKALCATCHGPDSTRSVKRITDKNEAHMPADEDCGTCHQAHGSEQPNLLAQAPEAHCYECHDTFPGRFSHSAVRLGRCGDCHDPHGGEGSTLLRAEGAQLCFKCHQDDLTGRPHTHAPVADGECGTCHDPHASDHPQLLSTATVNETCLMCHDVGLDQGKVHEAVTRFGCTGCHDPHGSAAPRQLLNEERALCAGCHPKQKDGLHVFTGTSGKPHPVAGVDDPKRPGRELSCTSCHSPHATGNPRLWYLGTTKMESCGHCHAQYGALNPTVPRKPAPVSPAAPQAAPEMADRNPTAPARGDS